MGKVLVDLARGNDINVELSLLFSMEKWQRLAHNVREYNPDVVVLVARKTPRLAEILGLSFGRAIVISDLAIPFCSNMLAGRRIAIIDDVINIGSTIDNARKQVIACHAESCVLFALAAKLRSNSIGFPDFQLVDEDPMNDVEYEEFVRQVPSALQLVPKPYDLDYPVCNCVIKPPFRRPGDICSWFTETFGRRLHILTTEREERFGFSRFTVDFPTTQGANLKARFYFDFTTNECNVVAMAIPAIFSQSSNYSETTYVGKIWRVLSSIASTAPAEACLWDKEPLARAELFVHSLSFCSTVLSEVSQVIGPKNSTYFSITDASYIFGPTVANQLSSILDDADLEIGELDKVFSQTNLASNNNGPFWSHLQEDERELIKREAVKSIEQGDVDGAFHSLFEGLANVIGATNIQEYSLSWPFTKKEVLENPYLRLRIGFSFMDLLSFFEPKLSLLLDSRTTTRAIISALIDRYIDSGALVPTIANYNGCFYRVYRKGEGPFWVDEVNKALYAWKCIGKPLSLTRFTKLQAILSFSSEVTTSLVPNDLERGTVGFLPSTVIDQSGTEIGRYLLRTGKLKAVGNE
jgi:hypothetical protein